MSTRGTSNADTREQQGPPAEAAPAAVAVAFLGWLPVFKRFGNCGAHPQFAHTAAPPPGYEFVRSPNGTSKNDHPSRSIVRRIGQAINTLVLSVFMMVSSVRRFGVFRTLAAFCAFVRLVFELILQTGRVLPALRFAHSRSFESQVLAPRGAELVFLTSVPYTYGQNPWVIEIEDPTTLFFPFVENGRTAELDLRRSPYFGAVRALLEADHCRGIVTHMRSTAELLPTLFQSEAIARKVTYAPLGVRLPERYQAHDADDDAINLLFTNSWHQMREGFFVRGGLDVLEAFDVLRRRYPRLRLTVRSSLPRLDDRYHRILESGWVRVIDRFMPAEAMAELQADTHIFLLPAARIHIVSVLQAMAHGQALVVSDGWGMSEYVEHGRNGLIVPGRAGTVTWADPAAGMLREDYRPMYSTDKRIVDGLIESVSLLIEQRTVRRRLGAAARTDVAEGFTLERWNAALKSAFDKARNVG